jgi:SAM-dependent methyltransferase
MLTHIRRLVPPPLKRAVRRSLAALVLAEDSELRRRLHHLEERVFDLTPDVVTPPADVTRVVEEFLLQKGISPGQVNLNISKHDLMCQYMIRKRPSVQQGYVQYFRSGLHMMEVLRVIVLHTLGHLDRVAFLDFASGYGRLTRFLAHEVDPKRIWVSDVKIRAVEFQREQFGVHGLVSTDAPEDFLPGIRFDCIFVASLFTHLPESSFERWLQRLYSLLSPRGLLIFTVNDVSLLGKSVAKARGNDFVFHRFSEEVMLRSGDQALDVCEYGSTYISEAFVRRALQEPAFENKRYARYDRGMWSRQDIYILFRENVDELSGLSLPGDYPATLKEELGRLKGQI